MDVGDFPMPPDPRMHLFIGGVDEAGRPLPISPTSLRAIADSWPLSESTPAGIATLLKTSRDLYVFSYFVYEFLTLAVLVSLQAVEAGLSLKIGRKLSFKELIDRAREEGLIEADTQQVLHAGRKLRNSFSHPSEQAVWTYGMTRPLIAVSHGMIATLFADRPETSTPEGRRT